MCNMIRTIELLENARGEVGWRKNDLGLGESGDEAAFEMDFTGLGWFHNEWIGLWKYRLCPRNLQETNCLGAYPELVRNVESESCGEDGDMRYGKITVKEWESEGEETLQKAKFRCGGKKSGGLIQKINSLRDNAGEDTDIAEVDSIECGKWWKNEELIRTLKTLDLVA